MDRDFRHAQSDERKEQIYRATQLEANRLEIMASNERNSAAARRSLAEREAVFRREAERQHDALYGSHH